MRSVLALALAAFVPNASAAETSDLPNPSAILAMGAYVPSDDMQMSKAFYRTLFDRVPVVELPDFVAFEIAGGWFAVVSRDRYAPGAKFFQWKVPFCMLEPMTFNQYMGPVWD